MKKIDSFSSFEGREILHRIFHKLRYEKRLSSYITLITLWRIVCFEKQLNKYLNEDISIAHSLGFFSGTFLWMEEIVNRFYFSTINSFVYFGAAILLVLIGMRRFSDRVTDDIVIAGIIFEALMLVVMFVIMLFSPKEDTYLEKDKDDKLENDMQNDLLDEIGEISRDFAASLVQLESLTESIVKMNDNQELIADRLEQILISFQQANSPNPQMLEEMKNVNSSLTIFQKNLNQLNTQIESLKKEEIEITVRKEIEKLISKNITEK